MTVSLALRNSREVSAETRQRILRLARARGYRPDPSIVRLMHHLRVRAPSRSRANIVGLFGARWRGPRPKHNFMTRLCAGLSARAEALGYNFSQMLIEDYPTGEQLGRVLANRGVEGVIVLPLLRPSDLSELLDWSAFSVVAATPSLLAPRFHAVMPNHFDNMLVVCSALERQGFRRIGLAISHDWDARVKHRWSGGVAWQNGFGGTEPVPPLITAQPGPNLEIPIFVEWLRRERPDVVVTDATLGSALLEGLAQIPARIRPKIVTMNWPDAQCDGGLDQRPEHLGACAVDVLAGLLTRGEKGIPAVPSSTLIDGEWKSVGVVPRSGAMRRKK